MRIRGDNKITRSGGSGDAWPRRRRGVQAGTAVLWYNIGMKIKKPVPAANAAAPSTGGATIADRFRLDLTNPDDVKAATVGKNATVAAFVAGLVALGVAGLLTFILFQHWSFLQAFLK